MGTGPTTRNWSVDYEGETHYIQIRHNIGTSLFKVLVDGKQVPCNLSFEEIKQGCRYVRFLIGEKEGQVKLSTKGVSLAYEVTFGKEKLKEMVFDVLNYDTAGPIKKVYLPPAAIIRRIGDKKVVFFKVQVTSGGEGAVEQCVLEKRFSDFVSFDEQIQGSFNGHHLQSSLPRLPPRKLSFLTDHLDKNFVRSRRNALQNYITKLLAFPKVTHLPDFLSFFSSAGASSAESKESASEGKSSHVDRKSKSRRSKGGAAGKRETKRAGVKSESKSKEEKAAEEEEEEEESVSQELGSVKISKGPATIKHSTLKQDSSSDEEATNWKNMAALEESDSDGLFDDEGLPPAAATGGGAGEATPVEIPSE